jgi:hypothetical protein
MNYYIGLDLGQRQDFTALAVVEQHFEETNGQQPRYQARHLQRYELGTSYPTIVASVGELLKKEPLSKANPSLVIDATGVGQPVVDMFVQAELPCEIIAVTITGGFEPKRDGNSFNVPKRDLVSAIQVALQTDRLKIAPALPEAGTLVKELENFQVKITENAHDTYGAWREGTHDDLVLAVALPLWYGAWRDKHGWWCWA